MIEPAKLARMQARSVARLAAVQALYQMDIAETDLSDILAQHIAGGIDRDGEGTRIADADGDHFRDVVKGVVATQDALDPKINAALAEGWLLTRVDATLRAILRAGTYELAMRTDVPFKTVINEYVDLAHAFFDGDEPAVVNGVLDRLARSYRDVA
jgi:N utilization substance protein B